MRKHYLSILALIVMAALAAGSVDSGTDNSTIPSSSTGNSTNSTTSEWYSGGTLHKKTASDWQTARYSDKLATCADFLTSMWKNGDLKPSISNSLSTVDDVKPYAKELVDFLDAAFKRDADPEQNRILFTNQTVASTAAIGTVTMGWAK